MSSIDTKDLWYRWVAANGLGEMLGLGLTFAVGGLVISSLGEQGSVFVILASFIVAVVSGVIEATIVGFAQWWAMHPWFPAIPRKAWWLATLWGALIAYCMGYLPPTLMSLGEQATGTAAAEPPQWVVLLLAAGLGLAGGAVLSFAQWLTLRKNAPAAGLWIPANMLAWMVGMPLIFLGIDIAQRLDGIGWVVLFMAGVLLITGLLVGAIHGSTLVRIAESGQQRTGTRRQGSTTRGQ